VKTTAGGSTATVGGASSSAGKVAKAVKGLVAEVTATWEVAAVRLGVTHATLHISSLSAAVTTVDRASGSVGFEGGAVMVVMATWEVTARAPAVTVAAGVEAVTVAAGVEAAMVVESLLSKPLQVFSCLPAPPKETESTLATKLRLRRRRRHQGTRSRACVEW